MDALKNEKNVKKSDASASLLNDEQLNAVTGGTAAKGDNTEVIIPTPANDWDTLIPC